MKVFLVGFMGCGKTTAGKKIAARLGYSFTDLDQVFEAETGKAIPEYFSEFGEDEFRKKEKYVLQNTPFADNSIIATGGGLPCYFDNMDWMNASGFTVYLKLSPKALAARLENAGNVRPVLQHHKGKALEEFIKAKLTEREPFYSKAKLTVTGLDLNAARLAELIASLNP